MAKYILFKENFNFESNKEYIKENIIKIFKVTASEFFYCMETYSAFGTTGEAKEFEEKLLDIIKAYDQFDYLASEVEIFNNRISKFHN